MLFNFNLDRRPEFHVSFPKSRDLRILRFRGNTLVPISVHEYKTGIDAGCISNSQRKELDGERRT